jgi:hypothetical protein
MALLARVKGRSYIRDRMGRFASSPGGGGSAPKRSSYAKGKVEGSREAIRNERRGENNPGMIAYFRSGGVSAQSKSIGKSIRGQRAIRELEAKPGYRSGRAAKQDPEFRYKLSAARDSLATKLRNADIKAGKKVPDTYETDLKYADRAAKELGKQLRLPRRVVATATDYTENENRSMVSRRAAAGTRPDLDDDDVKYAGMDPAGRRMKDRVRDIADDVGNGRLEERHYRAMSDYIDSSAVNKKLRGQRGANDLTDAERNQVRNLDGSIGTMREQAITYRGLNAADLEKRVGRLRPGKRFSDPGYGSTSLSARLPRDFADGAFSGSYNPPTWEQTVMRVRIKPGTKVIVPQRGRGSPNVEGEIILPRGTEYRVRGVSTDYYENRPYTVVDVEVDTSRIVDWSLEEGG